MGFDTVTLEPFFVIRPRAITDIKVLGNADMFEITVTFQVEEYRFPGGVNGSNGVQRQLIKNLHIVAFRLEGCAVEATNNIGDGSVALAYVRFRMN